MRRLTDSQIRAIRAGISDKTVERAFRRSSHGKNLSKRQKKSNSLKQNPNIQRIYAKGTRVFANKKLNGPTRIPGVKINGKPAVAVPRNDGKFNVIGAYAQSRNGKNYGLAVFSESGKIMRFSGRRTPRIQKAYSIIKNGGRSFKKGSTGHAGG